MDKAFSTTLGGNITSNNDPGATDGAQLTALQPIWERESTQASQKWCQVFCGPAVTSYTPLNSVIVFLIVRIIYVEWHYCMFSILEKFMGFSPLRVDFFLCIFGGGGGGGAKSC